MCEFVSLKAEHISRIVAAFAAMGWSKPASQYENYVAEQNDGIRSVIVAFEDDKFLGYVCVLWASGYPPFRENGIPEISDLNVLPDHRRRGIGSKLITKAEQIVKQRSTVAGIGVGVDADYGPAQRLYVKLGYFPDGRGVSSHGKYPKFGERVTVDDSLNLFFTKELA